MARMSKTLTSWSREAVATKFPDGLQAAAWTVFLCPCLHVIREHLMRQMDSKRKGRTHKVVSTLEVRGSQNLMRLSLLPDTRRPFVGCHLTHLTSHP